MFFTLFFFLLTHQEGRKCDLALGQYVAKILIIHQVVALEAQILCHYLSFVPLTSPFRQLYTNKNSAVPKNQREQRWFP